MFNEKKQGNGHKVAGTQEIYERVAEICSKYGIEFEDKMLRHSEGNKWNPRTWWSFLPCQVELTAPNGKVHLLAGGMTVYDNNPGYWFPINCSKEDFEDNEIAAFDEIATILV